MPQFDVYSFMSQLFWVFLFFFIFYVIVLRWILPSIAVTLKVRKKIISSESNSEIKLSSRSVVRIKGEPLLVTSSSKCLQSFQSVSDISTSNRIRFDGLTVSADHKLLQRYHSNVCRRIKSTAVSLFLDS